MKINERLNLIVPIEQANGTTIYVHSQPISPEAFDAHYKLIAKTHNEIYAEYGAMTGPRIAAKIAREMSIAMSAIPMPGRETVPGSDKTYRDLMDEISRLTMVILPSGNMLLAEALGKGVISREDRDELENALVFFTVVSAMDKPRRANAQMEFACGLWGGQMSPFNSTEFLGSLKKSTEAGNTGGSPAPASSVPS